MTVKLTVYGAVDIDTGLIHSTTYERPAMTPDEIKALLCEMTRATPLAICVLCKAVEATSLVAFGGSDHLRIAPVCDRCAESHRPEDADESLVAADDGAIFEVRHNTGWAGYQDEKA